MSIAQFFTKNNSIVACRINKISTFIWGMAEWPMSQVNGIPSDRWGVNQPVLEFNYGSIGEPEDYWTEDEQQWASIESEDPEPQLDPPPLQP